jgi:hypothetical protein
MADPKKPNKKALVVTSQFGLADQIYILFIFILQIYDEFFGIGFENGNELGMDWEWIGNGLGMDWE